jgi:hypothetical protein
VVRGKTRCHWHGGRNPGPPPGSKNGLIHGRWTREAIAAKREAAAKAKLARHEVAQAKEAVDVAIAAAAGPRKRRARIKAPPEGG